MGSFSPKSLSYEIVRTGNNVICDVAQDSVASEPDWGYIMGESLTWGNRYRDDRCGNYRVSQKRCSEDINNTGYRSTFSRVFAWYIEQNLKRAARTKEQTINYPVYNYKGAYVTYIHPIHHTVLF